MPQHTGGGPPSLLDLEPSHDVTRQGLEVAGEKSSEAALWKDDATTLLGDLPGDPLAVGFRRASRV